MGRFWTGTYFSFQLKDKEWQKGELTSIKNDSFYIRPRIVRYGLFNSDTTYLPIRGFSLSDVYALPNKGILIDYINDRFQISRTGGHVHFYWIKSGFLFRLGAASYAGVHLVNGLVNDDLSLSGSSATLISAAAVFMGGVLLHKIYKPYLPVGRKYSLRMLDLSH